MSLSLLSPRGASRIPGSHLGCHKENTMRIRIATILAVLATVGPLNAAAQAGTTQINLGAGETATIVVTAGAPAVPVAAVAPAPKPVVVRKVADPVKEKANCEAQTDAKWDDTKKVPSSQLDVDERCDLSKPNAGQVLSTDRFAFCNDPKDPEVERHVYAENICNSWARDRRMAARLRALEERPAAPTVDLKPLEAKVGDNEVETARVAGELKTVAGALEALEGRTDALEAEVKAHAARLALSPACALLAEKGASLLSVADVGNGQTGFAVFEECLKDPKTDPIARVSIAVARENQQRAEAAYKLALEAKESAARAVHIGIGYQFSVAPLQPIVAPSSGQVVQRGSNNVAPLGLALLLHAEQLRLEVGLGWLLEDARDATGKTFGTSGFAGQLRAAYVWSPSTEWDWFRAGVTGAIRVQGTDFFASAPSARAFAFGGGGGLRVEGHNGPIRLILDVDLISGDWVSASVGNTRITSSGYTLPVRLILGLVF